MTPKDVERNRYNQRSALALKRSRLVELNVSGAASVPPELRRPYLEFEESVRAFAKPGTKVLDICCGSGQHSIVSALCGANVIGMDLAEEALQLAEERARRANVSIQFVHGDADSPPFADHSFDLITCAGSLSYVDLTTFLKHLERIIVPGGAFVFVDSLNHNPVYRLNRYVNYLRGRRSLSTLLRMPTQNTLETIRRTFPDLRVSYHGIFSFLAPVLRPLGRKRASKILDQADSWFHVFRRYAFKVVGQGHLPG